MRTHIINNGKFSLVERAHITHNRVNIDLSNGAKIFAVGDNIRVIASSSMPFPVGERVHHIETIVEEANGEVTCRIELVALSTMDCISKSSVARIIVANEAPHSPAKVVIEEDEIILRSFNRDLSNLVAPVSIHLT